MASACLLDICSFCEAIEVLYAANHFSFRGITGVTSFNNLVSPSCWNMLRKVHISTTFLTPMKHWMDKRGSFPRENYQDWVDGCRTLATLDDLRTLQVEITIRDQCQSFEANAETVEEAALVWILNSLKLIRAVTFRVTLNIDLPPTVVIALGDVPFQMTHHGKKYDHGNFI